MVDGKVSSAWFNLFENIKNMACFKLNKLNSTVKIIPSIIRYASFKSSISLDKLYPETLDIKKFQPPKAAIEFNGYIPINELEITFCRSSGPGGQHVNRTNTKVDIRFHVDKANWLSNELKTKLKDQYLNQINKDGFFIIRSEKTRAQLLNQADAVTRLRDLLYKLEQPELTISPETEEKLRKNKERATRQRLAEKRSRSLVKAARQGEL